MRAIVFPSLLLLAGLWVPAVNAAGPEVVKSEGVTRIRLLPPTPGTNPRNSEGSFVTLKDGRLLEFGRHGHPAANMFDQPELEQILRKRMLEQDSVDFRGNVEVLRVEPSPSGVAEVEYEDRKDPAVDVAFALLKDDVPRLESAFKASATKQVYAVICTTTPWTLPANQALNVHPEFTYELVDTSAGLLILAAELREACLARYGLPFPVH